LRLAISSQHVLAAAALIAPPVGVIAPQGMAPVLAVVAVMLVLVEPRPTAYALREARTLAVLLALTASWGALSAVWSIIPGHSLFEAGRFAILSIAGMVTVAAGAALPTAGRAVVGRAAITGLCLGLLIIVVELRFGFPIHHALGGGADRIVPLTKLDRAAVVMSLLCWVAILALTERGRGLAAGALFGVAAYALLHLVSISAILGLFVGAVVYALARWRPRQVAGLAIAGLVVLSVALPLVPVTRDTVTSLAASAPWLRTSALHRLVIWRFTSDRIAEHPLLGRGMDASREMPGGKTDIRDYLGLSQGEVPSIAPGTSSALPLHPHDAILQWWVELGAAGAALGLAIWAWVVRRAATWHTGSHARPAAALAAVSAAGPPLLLSFGIWQAWWQSTLWLTAALLIAVALPQQTSGNDD
jgi:O-antigen ligase